MDYNLKDIKAGKATITIFSVLILLSPGGLGLFLLQNQLFMSLDFAKLILLSLFLSAPFVLIAFALALTFFEGLVVESTNQEIQTSQPIPTTDTEENDYKLIILTQVFLIFIWMTVGLVNHWFFKLPEEPIAIAKELFMDYCTISFWILIVMLGKIYLTHRRRRAKQNQQLESVSSTDQASVSN